MYNQSINQSIIEHYFQMLFSARGCRNNDNRCHIIFRCCFHHDNCYDKIIHNPLCGNVYTIKYKSNTDNGKIECCKYILTLFPIVVVVVRFHSVLRKILDKILYPQIV